MVKIERSNKTVGLFLVMMVGTFLLDMIFVYPYIYAGGWFPIMFMIFTGTMVFFTLTYKVSPGYMKGKS